MLQMGKCFCDPYYIVDFVGAKTPVTSSPWRETFALCTVMAPSLKTLPKGNMLSSTGLPPAMVDRLSLVTIYSSYFWNKTNNSKIGRNNRRIRNLGRGCLINRLNLTTNYSLTLHLDVSPRVKRYAVTMTNFGTELSPLRRNYPYVNMN